MRDFDHNGLILAEYQGRLFERSTGLECSSAIFIRRFLHSELLEALDRNDPAIVSPDPEEGLECITRQFGQTEYGSKRYPAAAMFWMGYMYRYISYTRGQSTRFIMQLIPYRLLNDVYYSYHTQDPEWCVRSLLEIQGLTENIFDNNYRLKEIIKRKKYA